MGTVNGTNTNAAVNVNSSNEDQAVSSNSEQEQKKFTCSSDNQVFIEGGGFIMGSSLDGYVNAQPRRAVVVDSFCMDKTEMTLATLHKISMTAFNKLEDSDKLLRLIQGIDHNYPKAPDLTRQKSALLTLALVSVRYKTAGEGYPATNVSWSESELACRINGGRLPTEAQWEYAALGGKDFVYPTSDGKLFDENGKPNGSFGLKREDGPTKVCSYGENPYGLCDMAGNVNEWVYDWYQNGYNPLDVDNPEGPNYSSLIVTMFNGPSKVFRGGAWDSSVELLVGSYKNNEYQGTGLSLMSSSRNGKLDGNKSDNIGFRCVYEPIEVKNTETSK